LATQYARVRSTTPGFCQHLEPEDFVVQTMPDVSPAKWHLAHTTWFFEEFILKPQLAGYRQFDENYHYLFNSYYYSAGQMHPRPQRGHLSRPLVRDIMQYREHVDEAMQKLLSAREGDESVEQVVTLGIHHEQQHQELLLADIKNVFSCNPTMPAVNPFLKTPGSTRGTELRFISRPGGTHEIGTRKNGFYFDNETPRHQELMQDHSIGSRLITNGEFREFIRDGAYADVRLWLSDGWAAINERGWNRPLYWSEGLESEFTLGGQRDLDIHAPVSHVSYYEADAFARWADARLPTEPEWETFADEQEAAGNLQESGYWHPVATDEAGTQVFGDVWEWTSSPYSAYPGFTPLDGSLGEYNGKFMCNQVSVRGGSCVTARDHIRASYRSFFYPDARWQFLGIRLAKNGLSC
jgi:ergothioneine biosynthesis protein EgtB